MPRLPSFCSGWFIAAAWLLSWSSPLAQEPPQTTAITLRAFFDMIDEPAAIAEGAARAKGKFPTEAEVAEMRLTLPPQLVGRWLEIADKLQAAMPAADRVEVFPPFLHDWAQENEEAGIKRSLVVASLALLRDLAAAKATPGAFPHVRSLQVPNEWLERYWGERDKFARRMSDQFVAEKDGEELTVRKQNGTFFRGSGGNLVKVAEPGVPEEGRIYSGPFGKNGTWNLYQVMNRPATWLQADKAAAAMVSPRGEKKIAGHLASIHSEGENQFLLRLIEGVPHAWIGLNDRRLEAFQDKGGTWEWSSGEQATFFKWGVIEPNNAATPNNLGDEDGVALESQNLPKRAGYWSDYGDGSRVGFNHRYPYIVEWSVESPEPIEDTASLPSFFAEPLEGPAGKEGAFGLRVVYGGGKCRTLASAREAYLSGDGRVVNAQPATLNFRDPDGPVPGLLFPNAPAFPQQKEKEADNDFAFSCRGRIRVAEAGIYTFGIIHDDGFALRIKGHTWRSATGDGIVHPGDRLSVEHWWTAHQGCTLATIELPAGDHPLDFFGFQAEGGGYFQLFAAKGDFAALNQTRDWRLVGHRAAGDVVLPAIAPPGWEIEITPPSKLTRGTYDGAERALQRHGRKLAAPEPIVDFLDPDDGSDLRIPGAKPFPDGIPKQRDNDFAFRARGLLQIPVKGAYWLGFGTAHGGRLTIKGKPWKRIVSAGPGKAVRDEDLIEVDLTGDRNCRVVGEIELEPGQYPIEYLGSFAWGQAAVEITATSPGGADLHLQAGESRMVPDLPGLELVK